MNQHNHNKDNNEKNIPSINWILLRGLGREARHWGEFPQQLQSVFPQSRIMTLDLPGTGVASRTKTPDNMVEIVAYLRRQWQDLELSGPVIILAMSLGGMAAAEWIRQDPTGISGVVLINSSFAGLSPFYQRLRPQAWLYLFGAAWSAAVRKNVLDSETWVLNLVSNHELRRQEVLEDWVSIQRQSPLHPDNFAQQLKAAMKFRLPLAQLPPGLEALILSSQEDRMVSPRCSEKLAQLWHVPIEVHPTAGHDLVLDDAAWVCAQLKNWVLARSVGWSGS